ncbi:hypothetical protein ACHAW5_003912 [Stephanodiscus triporus]|uniref:P-type ATPase A domain-containing protein n=1 Tax=Stephanodiscus triporus TaxID=2934178 RepID=A0ABD3MI48_9STRA
MAGRSQINLHFFKEHVEPFHFLDVLSGLFELESNQVHAARVVINEPSSRVGRSQFFAKEICCASEIPQVEAILRLSKGVLEISVNPTCMLIMMLIAIADALSKQGFRRGHERRCSNTVESACRYPYGCSCDILFAISKGLEQSATSRARNALSDIICRQPEYANVLNPVTNDIVVLPANSVAVGTTVSVRTGDKIPCDGEVIEGTSTVDESSLTGESMPITKSTGMKVSGGTINSGNTQLVIRTTATSNNSAVARLIRLLEEAQLNRSETEKMVDSFAKVYTPIVVLAAFFMCTVPWAFGAEIGRVWVHNGLVTIVLACPCALIISTPVTYVAGLAAVAQKGVVCKGGQHLEGLGRVKSIFFDKTGTLSQGIFALLHFEVVDGARSREEVFGYLALMEAPAAHPLSDAIVKGAANEQVDIPKLKTQNHTLLPGEGITATVLGVKIHVGNKKLFSRHVCMIRCQNA